MAESIEQAAGRCWKLTGIRKIGGQEGKKACIFFTMMTEALKRIVCSDPEVMIGKPVFAGTRVPLQNLVN